MDVILVLEDGRLVEMGDYSSPIAQKGKLYQLTAAMGGDV